LKLLNEVMGTCLSFDEGMIEKAEPVATYPTSSCTEAV